MNARYTFILITTVVLMIAVFAGAVNALTGKDVSEPVASLSQIRDYAASVQNGVSYAVDNGILYKGGPLNWTPVATPKNMIVGAVTVDSHNADLVYVGAANEIAVYRSADGGENWERYPVSAEAVGGVTDIAMDSAQRIVYVGTDTAGLFRLRDVGSSLVLGAQLLLDEPVLEVAADDTGLGMAFARTERNLYRADDYGIYWSAVENLSSTPTALAIANTNPATVYVGTTDRGVLRSQDGGFSWTLANDGLGTNPGTRLHIDALTVDPMQPDVLYAAASYLFGSTTAHESPSSVAMTANGAQEWTMLSGGADLNTTVAELLPVSGETGAVYALTMESRSPQALGNAPAMTDTVMAEAPVATAQPLTMRSLLAWIIAGLAALALLVAITIDLRRRPTTLVPGFVHNDR